VAAAIALRLQEAAQGGVATHHPHHAKGCQTVDQAIVWDRPGCIGLKDGLGCP
jgi:hypothetical protein